MQRGYHVFRALSAACPCDLLAFNGDDRPIRIEVKTGYRRGDKTLASAPTRHGQVFDVLAVVAPDEIAYTPELPR